MLARRQRIRSGIERSPPREFPSHRAWVRGLVCVAVNAGNCEGRMEAAHYDGPDVPYSDRKGLGLKAHDRWVFPACASHHRELHQIGTARFEARHGLSLKRLADTCAATSPHRWRWESEE